MIRAWNRHLAPAASETLLVRSWRRFCIEKYNISRSGYLPKCHEMLRLPRKGTLQLHQILCLPRKMNLIIDPPHIWNVIYNARSNKSHPPTSPNTAPATQNESIYNRLTYYIYNKHNHIYIQIKIRHTYILNYAIKSVTTNCKKYGWNLDRRLCRTILS